MNEMKNKIMFISELSISNFRSIEKEDFSFHPYTILVGKNNTGKSNIMTALKLLLEGTKRDFSSRDFFSDGDNIVLEATINNVEHFLGLCAERHGTKIKEDIQDGCLKIQRVIHPDLTVDPLQIYDSKKKSFGLKTGIEASLKQLLPEVILIEAFQDPTAEAVGKSTATLGKIIKQILGRLNEQISEPIKDAYAKANSLLNIVATVEGDKKRETDERSQEIINIEDKVRKNLQEVFKDIDVRVIIDFPEVSELMAKSRIELLDHGIWTPPELKGQGVQRALYVALLRSLAEQLRQENITESNLRRPFLLLVEEPEIFLHPTVLDTMRTALESIGNTNQVVIATHSPSIVSKDKLTNVVLVRKSYENSHKARTVRLCGEDKKLEGAKEKRLCHLLSYQRSSKFLFVDTVIVVEGVSDVTLYEAILETWSVQSLDSLGIAIIDSESKDVAAECAELLRGIGLNSVCVLDNDFLWRGAGNFCKGSDYSRFVDSFWKLASKSGIVEEDDGKKRITKMKGEAAELIEKNLNREREKILEELKNYKIWVLRHGEIEDYVGLTQTSKAKGRFGEIAKKIRNGEQEIKYKDDLLMIFAEAIGLNVDS